MLDIPCCCLSDDSGRIYFLSHSTTTNLFIDQLFFHNFNLHDVKQSPKHFQLGGVEGSQHKKITHPHLQCEIRSIKIQCSSLQNILFAKQFCDMNLNHNSHQLVATIHQNIYLKKTLLSILLIIWSKFEVLLPPFCSHFASVTEYVELFRQTSSHLQHFDLTRFCLCVCVCVGFERESSLYCMFYLNPNLKFITFYSLLISVYQ